MKLPLSNINRSTTTTTTTTTTLIVLFLFFFFFSATTTTIFIHCQQSTTINPFKFSELPNYKGLFKGKPGALQANSGFLSNTLSGSTSQLFYIFIPNHDSNGISIPNSNSIPILIFLNGGPGCSTM